MGRRLRCAKCGDVIKSTHRHDYKHCNCGAVAVDGGDDYFKVVGEPSIAMIYKYGKWRTMEQVWKIAAYIRELDND